MFLILSFSCSNNASKDRSKASYNDTVHYHDTSKLIYPASDTTSDLYSYDTVLKRGYVISFSVDDSIERLYLKKDKIIKEIASCSKGLPYQNLGYKVADFTDYFVLAHSFGSGNPTYIDLIKKDEGLNILEKGAAWIGASDSKGFLLYCETGSPTKKDKMILYDVNRNKKTKFNFPESIFDESMVLNRISIDTITDKLLVVKYETKNGVMQQKYNR